eukprot:29120-Pelagococcus_subviridis.AAC.31
MIERVHELHDARASEMRRRRRRRRRRPALGESSSLAVFPPGRHPAPVAALRLRSQPRAVLAHARAVMIRRLPPRVDLVHVRDLRQDVDLVARRLRVMRRGLLHLERDVRGRPARAEVPPAELLEDDVPTVFVRLSDLDGMVPALLVPVLALVLGGVAISAVAAVFAVAARVAVVPPVVVRVLVVLGRLAAAGFRALPAALPRFLRTAAGSGRDLPRGG